MSQQKHHIQLILCPPLKTKAIAYKLENGIKQNKLHEELKLLQKDKIWYKLDLFKWYAYGTSEGIKYYLLKPHCKYNQQKKSLSGFDGEKTDKRNWQCTMGKKQNGCRSFVSYANAK